MSPGRPVPVIVSIDVEPEGRFLDRARPSPWRGFERAVALAHDVRPRVRPASGGPARFTWCLRMDPQIAEVYGRPDWIVHRHATAFAELDARGDDIGLHVHPYRWDDGAGRWVIDHADDRWIVTCLDTAFEAFACAFNRPCRTFRFGDRWMSGETVRGIEARGVAYDLTLEPGQPSMPTYCRGERYTGAIPDYAAVPSHPYRPSAADYRIADPERQRGVWMIPLTTARVRPRRLRRAYYRLFRRDLQIDVWTALVSHEPLLFQRIVDDALDRSSPTYLSLALRTGALAEPRLARRIEANLRWLMTHPLASRFTWTTPAGAIAALGLDDDVVAGEVATAAG